MFRHYVTQALRSFWRFRVTAAVNLAGLTLALICFIATYLYLQSLLNSDMHFKNAPRIYALTQELWTSPAERMIPAFPQVAPPAAKYLRTDLPQLEAVARALRVGSWAAASEDRKANLYAVAADPDFLKIFDLPFVAGDAGSALSSEHSAIITEGGATRLFGTSRDVIGRHVLLQNRADVVITGVIGAIPRPTHMDDAPNSLRFEIMVPMDLLRVMQSNAGVGGVAQADAPAWGDDSYFTYVLLPKDGSMTPAQLQAALKAFPARHVPKDQMLTVFGAVPVSRIKLANLEAFIGSNGLSMTTSIFLLDALVLAIACLNYANLAVAIATTRAREIGMRKVLGATQLHLMRQYLIEAALLGITALVIVLVGTVLVVPAFNNALGTELSLASLLEPKLWGLVVLLLAAISLIGGAYPALVLSRVRPVESLRAATVRAGPKFVPTVLVGIQFAAASFLLVVTLLIANQNQVLKRAGVRADRDPVVAIYNDIRQLGVPFETLRSELLRDPHIKSVTGTGTPPWVSGGWHETVQRGAEAASAGQVTMLNRISYDFLSTVGIDVLAGRKLDREHGDEFQAMDLYVKPNILAPVLIDRSLARQLGWQNPNEAVGRDIYQSKPLGATAPARPLHVIGVVEDGYPRLVGPNAESNLYLLDPNAAALPLVRISRDDVPAALAHIDAVWEKLSPKAPLVREFTDDAFGRAYQDFAVISTVLGGLATFAFIIAVMGLFGMALHVTSRRRREIGIRKTLGASMRRVVLMLLRDFSTPVVIANIIAWPFAFFMGRLYLNLFTHRAALSAWPFVLSLAITLAIAWLTVSGQAVRAASVKPANVLHLD